MRQRRGAAAIFARPPSQPSPPDGSHGYRHRSRVEPEKRLVPASLASLLAAAVGFVQAALGANDVLKQVDPFIGTGFHGHTFPGATMPFGMVQLSPDTRTSG
jgi:putative alpha-1,2-mannosidase